MHSSIYHRTSSFNTLSWWVTIKWMTKSNNWCMEILISKWWWCPQWTIQCQVQLGLSVKWSLVLSSTTIPQCSLQLCCLLWTILYRRFNLSRLEMQEDSSSSLRTATTCRTPSNSMVRILAKWCIKIPTMRIKTLIWCNSNMLNSSRWCKCNNMIRTPKVSMIQPRHPSWNRWQSMKKIDSQGILHMQIWSRDHSTLKDLSNNKWCRLWDSLVREVTPTQVMGDKERLEIEFQLIIRTWTLSCRLRTRCIVLSLEVATRAWLSKTSRAILGEECSLISISLTELVHIIAQKEEWCLTLFHLTLREII